MNGGTCTDDVNSYSCACVAGYTGEDCEIGMCCIINISVILYVLYSVLPRFSKGQGAISKWHIYRGERTVNRAL